MIKLKSLLLREAVNLKNGETFPLGDGYVLKHISYGYFIAYDSNNKKAMTMLVRTHREIPFVRHVAILDDHKGKGLFRRALLVLKKTFGDIRSDASGHTSSEADAAWVGVGATETPFEPPDPKLGKSKWKLDEILREATEFKDIPLGDGYVLKYEGNGEFVAYDSNGRRAMFLRLQSINKGIPAVFSVGIKTAHRGKGLYRKALIELKKILGNIRSNRLGQTSAEAQKAWRAVGAKERQSGEPYDKEMGDSRFKLDESSEFEDVPLGDGYVLNSMGNSEFNVYDLQGNVAMYIRINQRLNRAIPSIEYVKAYPPHNGQGLYGKALIALKKIFGNIRSDNWGDMSPEAERTWQNLGATQLTPPNRDTEMSKYMLEK